MPRNPDPSKKPEPAVDRPLPDAIEDALDSVPPAEPPTEPIDAPAAVATVEPPKAKPKAPATSTTTDLVSEELAREERLARAREELAFRRFHLLQEGDDLSSSEMSLLQSAFPRRPELDQAIWRRDWDRHLRHENARVGRVLGLQAIAGTPTDQATADNLAEQTAAKRDEQVPALEDQMRELQTQVTLLNQTAIQSEAASKARAEAKASLQDKKLLPQFVLDELNANCRRDTRSFGKALLQLETQQTTIQGILDLDVKTPLGRDVAKHHVGGNPRFGNNQFSRWECMFDCETFREGINTHCKVGTIRLNIWDEYLSELRIDLTAVDSQIAELTAGQQVDANREVDSLRSFYVPK